MTARSVARSVARSAAKTVIGSGASGGGGGFDYIGANAVGAYDIAALKTGVTRCFRVRRSSDNTEQDCLTVAEAVTFCGAGSGFAVTWYDQNGSNDVTQATTSLQPRIVNSGVADVGWVYDGSDLLAGSFVVGTTVTLAAWVKPSTGTQTFFAINSGAAVLRYNGSTTVAWFPNTGTTQVNITVSNFSGSWTHVALTQTGTTYALYINGVLVETNTTVSVATSGNGVEVGRFAGANGMNGPMRDVRIYSTAKDAAAVLAIKQSVTPT